MSRCLICGAELPPRRTKYCSDVCARKAERAKTNSVTAKYRVPHKKPMHEITCPDCGKTVTVPIKSKRCADCQRAADIRHDIEHKRRKRAGNARTIGGPYICECCGNPYMLNSGGQKWCEDCRTAMHRAVHLEESRRWNAKAYKDPEKREEKNAHSRAFTPSETVCKTCGNVFMQTKPSVKYCSPECRAAGVRKRQRAADAKRAEKRKEMRRGHEEDH